MSRNLNGYRIGPTPVGMLVWCAVTMVTMLACEKRGMPSGAHESKQEKSLSSASKPAEIQYFDQGWSAQDRDWFYNTSQGSQVIRYDWFLALESGGDESLLRSDESMSNSGFLPAPVSTLNPDGLPIGFAKDVDQTRGTFVGLTCAACHTGQIHFAGQRLRVDGGSGMGDVMMFFTRLHDSLAATLNQPAKFSRFAKRLSITEGAGSKLVQLRSDLAVRVEEMNQFLARNKPSSPAGNSRVPHFGLLVNEATGTTLGIPTNKFTTNAFTTIPSLWGFTELDWVGANASVNNPIARMSLEAMGVMAYFRLTDPKTMTFDSSFRFDAMYGMHVASSRLRAPRWNEAVFGSINGVESAKGEKLYAAHCEECHSRAPNHPKTAPNSFGKSFVKVKIVGLDEIGTDRTLVDEMLTVTSKTSFLNPRFEGRNEVLALDLTRVAIGSHLRNEFLRLKLSAEQISAYTGHRDASKQENLASYKSKALDGIWSTGPYLHNGSVPTLAGLLQKPEKRPKEFWIGNFEFDAVEVGNSTVRATHSTRFDTRLPGNGNMGHVYGTDLGETDKKSLLEFLKTL